MSKTFVLLVELEWDGREKAKAPMTKTAKGAFTGMRRFQFIEPIASPTALVVVRSLLELL
jgi:hypothetical protein